ncbi:MAG: NAD-dependent epimerase/dehydratase family protein [Gemmatimonadaceae bacterium]
MSDLHVVLGAHGNAGRAIVRELSRQGLPVRAVSRRPEPDIPAGVDWVVADLTDTAQATRVYRDARVVYLAAQPLYTRWAEDFPPLIDAVCSGAAGANLVFVDNAYAYGRVDGPLTEALPARPASPNGAVRARMAERLLEHHAKGTLRVAIGRASDFFGPDVGGSVVGDAFFADVLEGKAPRWLGNLDAPHTLSYIEDVARALVTLGRSEAAWGQTWHLPAANPVTGREFCRLACLAAGRPVAAAVHGRLAMTVAGWFSAIVRAVSQELYQWERPWVLDASRFMETFGPFTPTPTDLAVGQTVAWYRDAWND